MLLHASLPNIQHLDQWPWSLVEELEANTNIQFMVAGGAVINLIRDEPVGGDLDIWVPNQEDVDILKEILLELFPQYQFKRQRTGTVTLGLEPNHNMNSIFGPMAKKDIQIIHTLDYTDKLDFEAVPASFDFLCCQCWYVPGYQEIHIVNQDVLNDIRAKNITLVSLNYPLNILHRFLKYTKKGWRVDHNQLQRFINYVHELGKNNEPPQAIGVFADYDLDPEAFFFDNDESNLVLEL